MSNDLISRKALMECAEYDDNFNLIIPYKKVENAPTAYDVDCICDQIYEYICFAPSWVLKDIIEIVRNGGNKE